MKKKEIIFIVNKSFWIYLLLLPVLVFLGLFSRSSYIDSQSFIGNNAGDALWAAMAFVGFRILLYRYAAKYAVLAALIFSFFIEFLQLYQAPWIQSIRNTTFGALVLGHGFLWIDLLRYTVGICLMFILTIPLEKYRKSK